MHQPGDDVLTMQPSLAIHELEGKVADLIGEVLDNHQLFPLPLVLVQEVGDALVVSKSQLESDSVWMTQTGEL